jgi:hypothetical protein
MKATARDLARMACQLEFDTFQIGGPGWNCEAALNSSSSPWTPEARRDWAETN